MTNFTNEPPDFEKYMAGLYLYLHKFYTGIHKVNLLSIINDSTCTINKTGNWGRKYGYAECKISFIISFEKVEKAQNLSLKRELVSICDRIMQGTNSGLEVIDIDFIPSIERIEINLETRLEELLDEHTETYQQIGIPFELIDRAKEMNKVYTYLYFVENSLRIFIETISVDNDVKIPSKVQRNIDANKQKEAIRKYLPYRGEADIYYCDFIDLAAIITNNWTFFQPYFPSRNEHWITVMINELYEVRNLIAHNGYLPKDHQDKVKVFYEVIVSQLKVN